MISIKPVSDLRNYNEVLQDVTDDYWQTDTRNIRKSSAKTQSSCNHPQP